MMRRMLKCLGAAALMLVAAPTAALAKAPAYYPADYAKTVAASRREPGLLIYSNVAEYNWRDILAGFRKQYPWIKVATLDMGPSEVFERYYSEVSAKRKTADLIVSGAPDAWQRFVANGGPLPYRSPEASKLPAWSMPAPGLYTFSTDPMIVIYNKLLLRPNEYPKAMMPLANMAARNPARFRNKLTTYDASSHSFAYTIHWSVVDQKKPAGWELMAKLGPMTRPETGGAIMLDKVTAGEYLVAYYTSGLTVFPRMGEAGRAKIIGWTLPKDGTPVMLRGMSVTKGARSPASAKLMLDYLLSHDGQVAAGKGGMTPYRSDVADKEVPFLTYRAVERRVGPKNIVMVGYDPDMIKEYRPFIARWNQLFKSKR